MPKIASGASDKTQSIMSNTDEILKSELSVTTHPVVVCGVQRKINIGDFETIDVYCSAALPVPVNDVQDFDELEAKLIPAMEKLLYLTSKETGEKYSLIKNS